MTAPLDEARLRELAPWTQANTDLLRVIATDENIAEWFANPTMPEFLLSACNALDALSAERERGDRAYTAAADYCEFYAEERMTLCGDTILHDPLLKGGDFTMDNMVKSQELNIDGTINSAAYHAAMNLAAHFRSLATQKAEGAET